MHSSEALMMFLVAQQGHTALRPSSGKPRQTLLPANDSFYDIRQRLKPA
jgi:hypothetical protein